MNTKKIMSIALALFLNAGIITACTQTPNTVDPSPTVSPTTGLDAAIDGNTSTIVADNSGTVSSDQDTVSSEVQSDTQDDETTITDSEVVAENTTFSTKANTEGSIGANVKINKGDKGLGLRTIFAKILGKNRREKLINDSQAVLKAKIKLNEAKLKVLKNFKKSDLLKRKNIDVQNSDTVEVINSDGTISKISSVKFQGKSETSTRENKIIKTYAADGTTLIKVEHYLTVDFPNFDRTYTKIVNYNNDGSKKVVVKSEAKWTDGKSRVVNEERNIDASGNGTGIGTVVVVKKDGTTKTYDINVAIKAGTINISPVNPAPVPTAEPTIAPTPNVETTAVPTEDPSPTATATTAVEVITSVGINI